MFYQIFRSPQVKRWAITTYKHGISELAHELSNESFPLAKMKVLLILAENSWKTEMRPFPQCAIPHGNQS